MADTLIKLHILSTTRSHSGSLIDVVIILCGAPSLSELLSANTFEGMMTIMPQESLRAITINKPLACLEQVFFFNGENSTAIPDAVRITSTKSHFTQTDKANFAEDNIFCGRGIYFRGLTELLTCPT